MKKESVNTFDKGLVFDLNPLTTPNNVLTDAVNATFITFNGDELSLQNDAGNAPIQTVDGVVHLTEGFQPLGMKEFGGVLYIASRKLPDININNILEWNQSVSYIKDDLVYSKPVWSDIKIFYQRKDYFNNTLPKLPEESNKYWDIIGTEEDYNNRFGIIEFGSYPSPEASDSKSYYGTIVTPDLYKYSVINTTDFKTGRYIIFNNSLTIHTENISQGIVDYSEITFVPKFYRVKLYHQLNNGYLDLTQDIWLKYNHYKNFQINVGEYWFNDNNFRYYCPSQYKGKLALSLEIEDLKIFKVIDVPTINLSEFVGDPHIPILLTTVLPTTTDVLSTTDPTTTEELTTDEFTTETLVPQNYYSFSLTLQGIAQKSINLVTGDVKITKAKVKIYLDKSTEIYDEWNVEFTDNLASYIIYNISGTNYNNKLLEYVITPILSLEGFSDEYTEDDLPKEFLDKYTIHGSILINTSYDNIKFIPQNDICINGNMLYQEYWLQNNNGEFLDYELKVTDISNAYIFLLNGLNNSYAEAFGTPTIINYFTIGENNKALIVEPLNTNIDEYILQLFQQQIVLAPSQYCQEIPTTTDPNSGLGICWTILIPLDILYSNNYPLCISYLPPNEIHEITAPFNQFDNISNQDGKLMLGICSLSEPTFSYNGLYMLLPIDTYASGQNCFENTACSNY